MSNKSLLDYAFDVLNASNKPLSLKDLFDKAKKEAGFTYAEEEAKKKMAALYTDLSTDGRFTLRDDYTWDLRNRYKIEDILKNQVDYDTEDDSSEEDDFEEREYLKAELGMSDEANDQDNIEEGEFVEEEKPEEVDDF